jgi:glyoxylase-like metal-dependent hydrolase (beta-lactamase superfamily II)/rhodanese-related sulfurtransferase
MNVVPFVHEGLGNSSYLVELGDGAAALVDPDRTTARYLAAAEARGWRIVAALETHLHADFISGVRQLGDDGVPRLFLPAAASAHFPHEALTPGARLRLGEREVEVIASPGHTPEHVSYVIRGPAGPPALFSGGSLLMGGAARTDLIAPEQTDALTRAQYRTLTQAFAALPDETRLYPTHGGGSFCSAGASGERTSTLGRERAANPWLAYPDEEGFARDFPESFPAAPAYFFRLRPVNQAGPRLRRDIALPPPLDPTTFDAARRRALVIDVRSKEAYAAGHIPGALSNAFRDAYATWLGWLVPPDTPLLFVTDDAPLDRVIDESLLVGYERFAGWLAGGMDAWRAAGLPVKTTTLLDAHAAHDAVRRGAVALDVREPDEFAASHLAGARHVPLGSLCDALARLPRDRPILAYCGHGERAATALSLLERSGFGGPLLNLDDGLGAWQAAGYPVALS